MGVISEPVRAWLYRIFTAVVVVLIAYKVIDPNEAVAWGGLIIALLGNTLATVNTTTKTETPDTQLGA